MKETEATSRTVTLKPDRPILVERATVVMTDTLQETRADVRCATGFVVTVLRAREAAELEQAFGRIRELLTEHENRLALKSAGPAVSNKSEHGDPDPPEA